LSMLYCLPKNSSQTTKGNQNNSVVNGHCVTKLSIDSQNRKRIKKKKKSRSSFLFWGIILPSLTNRRQNSGKEIRRR
jgi:hypothetical protein